jgi:hypothetical protein
MEPFNNKTMELHNKTTELYGNRWSNIFIYDLAFPDPQLR